MKRDLYRRMKIEWKVDALGYIFVGSSVKAMRKASTPLTKELFGTGRYVLSDKTPEGKPRMEEQGLEKSVMPPHHIETLPERLLVVEGRLSLLHVIGHDGMDVAQQQSAPFPLFHHPDAPVYVC